MQVIRSAATILFANLFVSTALAADKSTDMISTWNQGLAPHIRARAKEVLAGVVEFLPTAGQAIHKASPTGSAWWHIETTLYSALFILIGIGAAMIFARWARQHFIYLFNPQPKDRAEKLGYLLTRGLMQTVMITIYLVIAMLLSVIFDDGNAIARHTHFFQIVIVGLIWFGHVMFSAIFAQDAPTHRMLPLSDAEATSLHRSLVCTGTIGYLILAMCAWMEAIGLNKEAHILSLIMGMLVAVLIFCAVLISQRKTVAEMFLRLSKRREPTIARRIFARIWHVIAVLYVFGAWVVLTVRLLLDLSGVAALVLGPLFVLFLGITLYAVFLLIIDRTAARRAARFSPEPEVVEAPAEADPDGIEDGWQVRPHSSLKQLAEHGAALVVFMIMGWILGLLWGVDVTSDEALVVNTLDLIIVVFISYLAFKAIRIFIDQKIEDEGGFDAGEPGEEGGGASASRLATLLPIFRNFLLITVATIAGMIFLSQLGVDIAPLFAGAGVVGLAIGFGAQTLIRDIFSGAFFLMDDAFRKGEYIDVDSAKGTVEKISIRSMQLRHHLGAVHTIPFGEIKQLTNYSRDWAMMKLTLRVTYDTDVEKVRKLIKKLGTELQEHPEVGEKFLQPLKSQGVFSMEDSAMILRVKFMTRPGEQFVIRKLVYARIRELFDANGINFAHRQVTVVLAEDDGHNGLNDLSKAQKQAITGAVAPALEPPTPAGGDGR